MDIAIIGAGINGLVAANYLQRAGHQITIVERKAKPGGACSSAFITLNNKTYEYPPGASVFGLMPDFIFSETGLSNFIDIHVPVDPDIGYFPSVEPCYYYEDHHQLANEMRQKWGEQGDIVQYHADLRVVADWLRRIYRWAITPTEAEARNQLGILFDRWVKGSALDLFGHYFTSDLAAIYHSIPVNESSPVSLSSPYSAFNIPIMNSGSCCGPGRWGFVKGGLWQVTEHLMRLNLEAGVKVLPGTKPPPADIVVFATDPITAARLIDDPPNVQHKRYLGTSAKQVFFFREPVIWKGGSGFRFIFEHNNLTDYQARIKNEFSPTYFEVYPEGTAMRQIGWEADYDYFAVFFKDVGLSKTGVESPEIQQYVEDTILPHVENREAYVGSVLLTPKDLCQQFYFPQGNIDHMELCEGQTFRDRTFSTNPDLFYQFGSNEKHFYCGAAAFPCGSVAGIPGYMCAQEILRKFAI